jgi:hypothetical protein
MKWLANLFPEKSIQPHVERRRGITQVKSSVTDAEMTHGTRLNESKAD